MTKQEFLNALTEKLKGLPKNEIEERLAFYSEMIDDRVEEGLSEEDAVKDIGSVEDVASQIISEIPFFKIVKNKIKPKREIGGWEIALLIIGSPIWLSLLIGAFAIIISLYASIFAVVVSLWAVFAGEVGCVLGGILGAPVSFIAGNVAGGLLLLAGGLICIGLAILTFYACKIATKGLVKLVKLLGIAIKKLFIKKEKTI